jgi:signal transduction histidine kinase/ligand-binding sensor domain-containing protein/CheY-like chemotaxis protein
MIIKISTLIKYYASNKFLFSFQVLLLLSFNVSANSELQFQKSIVNKELNNKPVWSIEQDLDGYLWFGTSFGVYKFNGYEIENIPLPSNTHKKTYSYSIRKLFSDSSGKLWLATNKNGLFFLMNGRFKKFNLNKSEIIIKTIFETPDKSIWIGSNLGLFQIKGDKTFKHYPIKSVTDYTINGIAQIDDNSLLLGTDKGLLQFNLTKNDLQIKDSIKLNDLVIYTLHKDEDGTIWIGAKSGLYEFSYKSEIYKHSINERIQSILSDGENLWIGSIYHGLYKLNKHNRKIEQYLYDKNSVNSLADSSVFSLFKSHDQKIWVGTFNAGVNTLPMNSTTMKTYRNSLQSIYCSPNNVFKSAYSENDIWWLGTESGLIRYDSRTSKCQLLLHDSESESSLSHNLILSIDKVTNGNLLISTGSQLNLLNTKSLEISRLNGQVPKLATYFSIETENNNILIGTIKGLYLFNQITKKSIKLNSIKGELDDAQFFSVTKDKNGNMYFATSKGIAYFGKDKKIKSFAQKNISAENNIINSIFIDKNEYIWVGVDSDGLYQFSKSGDLISVFKGELSNSSNPFIINSIEEDKDSSLWLGTNKGILHYFPLTNSFRTFNQQDGTQGSYFLRGSSFLDKSGKFFFGGRNGLNVFYSKDISHFSIPPPIVLTKLNLFSRTVNVGDKTKNGFLLDKSINDLNLIELGHKDYVMGFEFSALDYSDSASNQYAYRLKGFNNEWSYVGADNRRATYTNLNAGDYIFEVKGSNKDGIWSIEPKQLKITIHPAPWLSPWAYFAYFIITILSVWYFIRYKTIASRKRTELLELTVKERTKMVEALLEHKNEVFANITHEFKTPLSLILGPAEELQKLPGLVRGHEELNMIKRNAKRLLHMVGQILKLSQAEISKEVIRESQAVQPILTMLHESFIPLAIDKNIILKIENNHDVSINATTECLELVIGNLLSNSLKFTSSGGEITITTESKKDHISIIIEDSGTGIDKNDQDKIFKRFSRLDTHKNIQGTGIGLSVAKEITEANNGQISVESVWGQGSSFTVTFPITTDESTDKLSQLMVDQLVDNTKNELKTTQNLLQSKQKTVKNKVNILIIEDNLDMQKHIHNVLKKRFNCLIADRGRAGIALALQELPDIVICDVMMPGMDGYQVTRILRNDGRTSHIPIILLTALNTKESRIKGWRENIDVYVAKPFDALELNTQLDNILAIRQILQKKTSKAIKTNNSITSLDLPLQDLNFIEKFKTIIGKYYTNEYFQIADLASKMAISERQLQRKIKALVAEKPMDILRDYRLEKAATELKNGFQVSIVSDKCGFSSVSYFCRCFKNKYGVTAKQYQTLNKKK